MTDPSRYRYDSSGGRRSPPAYNPARSSMPVTSDPYGSLYAGDLHAMSASHHEGMTRPAEYGMAAAPVAGTTYSGRKGESLGRSSSVTDSTRSHHRALDAHTKRPVIVNLNKHAGPLSPRSGSPSRDPYRSSEEGPYYAEPASSITRGRPPPLDDEDYRRLRERTHHDRLANRPPDSYRPARPTSLYAGPNHRGAHPTFEFSDDAYEYTKPSDLARYDLDHDRRPRARRPSIDRYYRPTVSISTDLTRPFEPPERRAHGPPPTTRGLEKIGWGATAGGIYDGAGARMPVPTALDSGPEPRRLEYETPGSPRGRPYVEDYYDDDPYYYRDYREIDDRDIEYFQDDRVPARGFGILVDANDVDNLRDPPEKVYRDDRRERRDPKRYEVVESRRRPDDDVEIIRHEHDDRDRRRRRDRDYDDEDRRERKERRHDDDEPDSRGDKARDKAAAGLGLAAASLALRKKDDRDRDPSPHRRNKDEDYDSRRQEEADRSRSRKEPLLGDEEFEIVEHPRDRVKARDEKERSPDAKETKESKDRKESKENGKAPPPRDDSPPSDDGRSKSRRRPSIFNPNDTAALAEMRARLAEANAKDNQRTSDEPSSSKDKDRQAAGKDELPTKESTSDRRPASSEKREPDDKDAHKDDSAPSRDLVAAPAREEKQVRVVPPPKEPEKKPIKGILKQPRAHFPEEPNPVREGVAPHKDDKSKSDVPPGARWTKISRKMVNPEALRIGKERFEVRDDFVIVLRVLSKEEIQAYATATAQLRGMCFFSPHIHTFIHSCIDNAMLTLQTPERRRKELERAEARASGNNDAEHDKERDRDDDGGDKKQRHHRQHRRGRDEDERDRREREREDRERERDRHARRSHRGREEEVEDDVMDVRRGHYRGHRD
ncbi:hypothetical protein VTJ49DRAFT_4735 [Mycothermus thermophilus]|uniref:DUF8035 domain-containing protein n=1 Tax=Humicola insolens TaxID=85995 RepID=A0ABR3V4L4_HUMIN